MHHCYVVIDNEDSSTSANIVACSDPTIDTDAFNEDNETLTILLQNGWRPVRETTMGSTKECSSVLVLLEKD